MAGGRPRTVSLSPTEMINLGIEMVEWIKKHPDTLHLSEWYTIEKGYIYSEWETFIKKKEFVGYYEQALRLVGKKYLDKTSNVREGISQRWQRVYFKDIRKQEDEDKQKDLDRELDHKKKLIDYQKEKDTDLPKRDQEVDDENHMMKENHALRMEVKEWKEKFENQSKAGSELFRGAPPF